MYMCLYTYLYGYTYVTYRALNLPITDEIGACNTIWLANNNISREKKNKRRRVTITDDRRQLAAKTAIIHLSHTYTHTTYIYTCLQMCIYGTALSVLTRGIGA